MDVRGIIGRCRALGVAMLFMHLVTMGGARCTAQHGAHGHSPSAGSASMSMSHDGMASMLHHGHHHTSSSRGNSSCPGTNGSHCCHALGACSVTPIVTSVAIAVGDRSASQETIRSSDEALTARVPAVEPPPPKA
jgi:hypothetical protein